MTILALDTATDLASVALRRDGRTISDESIVTSDGHSYLIYQIMQAALDNAGVALSAIDCFASAVGPGSFTGVRICLTAAKALAHAMGKPAAGVSNLQALATFGTAKLRSPIIDARRGQIYTAIYDSELKLVSDEIAVGSDDWKAGADVERIVIAPPLAPAIALCAELAGPENWHDPSFLDACYVRRADGAGFWFDSGAIRSAL